MHELRGIRREERSTGKEGWFTTTSGEDVNPSQWITYAFSCLLLAPPLVYSLWPQFLSQAFLLSSFSFVLSFILSFFLYFLAFLLVGIYGYLRCTKRLDAIFRLACALQKAHCGGIRVPIEGHTMKGIRCILRWVQNQTGPPIFSFASCFFFICDSQLQGHKYRTGWKTPAPLPDMSKGSNDETAGSVFFFLF